MMISSRRVVLLYVLIVYRLTKCLKTLLHFNAWCCINLMFPSSHQRERWGREMESCKCRESERDLQPLWSFSGSSIGSVHVGQKPIIWSALWGPRGSYCLAGMWAPPPFYLPLILWMESPSPALLGSPAVRFFEPPGVLNKLWAQRLRHSQSCTIQGFTVLLALHTGPLAFQM